MKRAIEDSFPIVEINRLAVPERNAFKPIYQMHKWFARRASCVFRAILLGALKPLPLDENGKPLKSGAEVIMDEFYKDHTNDPDTNGKVVLDPFMGGGTTIVESLRLGCKAIGIDLNPVAWFIVKTEIEPVDLDELRAAFDRLAQSPVEWSGKPLKETLLDLYKTECPSCGGDADIIYTFWVKSAICTDQNCRKEVPLYNNFIIAQKKPSIRYLEDCQCPECGKVFDWEIEPAVLVSYPQLRVTAGKYSAGHGRTTARWVYGFARKGAPGGLQGTAACPWCGKEVSPRPSGRKPKRKRVEIAVLLCPNCEEVWQFRGPLTENVQCPTCKHEYNPKDGNIPSKGQFQCSCGNVGKIIDSIRSLPQERLLPVRPYGIEAYCPVCARKPGDSDQDAHPDLFNRNSETSIPNANRDSILWRNKGKFFKRFQPSDLALYQHACELWEKHKENLPYPKSRIPAGQETNRLHQHHYFYWHQMFNPRQLLCLSMLLNAIIEEDNQIMKDMLLSGFFSAIESNNLFTRYRHDAGKTEGVFARHDFQPKSTLAEGNLWGAKYGKCTFANSWRDITNGVSFAYHPYDRRFTGRFDKKGKPILEDANSLETIYSNEDQFCLKSIDSRDTASFVQEGQAHLIVTDPPYASNVNYSELADFFYVWLRLMLVDHYPWFAPDATPKVNEIVENPTRGMSATDFEEGLKYVFSECKTRLKNEGLLCFTFHHSEGTAWEALLKSICEAGFGIESIYPIQSEGESSLHLMDKQAISYDLIHICRKRANEEHSQRSWAGVRKSIRDRARMEIGLIESGRYGNDPLSPMDKNIILIGKCLELYSKHYGKIVDHEGKPVALRTALEEIRMMVDQLTTEESALPPELEEIDAPSYVYLTCLCDKKEIKSDDVNKATKGICETSTLMERGLMIKGRARTYEVKTPMERLDVLKRSSGPEWENSRPSFLTKTSSLPFLPKISLLIMSISSSDWRKQVKVL